jgi:hypothetical protein|tara:strand:- start:5605 stop:5802 length:198 start_codon:yes stop_codon:yes gene_type:complete
MKDNNQGLEEVLRQQKSGFTKIKNDFKEGSTSPAINSLLELIDFIRNDEDALSKLQEEIVRHYGE